MSDQQPAPDTHLLDEGNKDRGGEHRPPFFILQHRARQLWLNVRPEDVVMCTTCSRLHIKVADVEDIKKYPRMFTGLWEAACRWEAEHEKESAR